MLDILTDNPTALNNPATANLIGLFDKATSTTGVNRTAPRSLALKLAEVGDEVGIQNISGLSQNELDSYTALSRGLAKQRQSVRGLKAQEMMLDDLEKHADTAIKWITGQEELTVKDIAFLAAMGVDIEDAKGDVNAADNFKKQYIRNIILSSLGLSSTSQLTSKDKGTVELRRILETEDLDTLAQELVGMVNSQRSAFLARQGASPLGTAQSKTEQRSIF
jgi:hypothetical protein